MSDIIDFKKFKNNKGEKDRRRVERIFLQNVVDAYAEHPENGSLCEVELLDVSTLGFAFRVLNDPREREFFGDAKDIKLRIYFGGGLFFLVFARVASRIDAVDAGQKFIRYGCEVGTDFTSYATFKGFVDFIKHASPHLKTIEPKDQEGKVS